MTLDEAIEHSLEMFKLMGRQCGSKSHSCSLEHLQLANWLKELKHLKESILVIISDGTMTDETKLGHINNILNNEY